MPVPAVTLHQQTYCLGELFAGAGGMALGASQAEFDGSEFSHVWINDIDKDACKTFARNLHIDETGVFCCDASKMNFDRLPSIDGLVFGFPCNDFSVVGEKLGMAGQFGGLATSGNAMEIITAALRRSGYKVSRQLYRFEEYGVPQSRHRIVFVGFRTIWGFPLVIRNRQQVKIQCRQGMHSRIFRQMQTTMNLPGNRQLSSNG